MRIVDPIYGAFVVPRAVAALASTPEVRRLAHIRLLNTGSFTLPTLGELRRYSHTMGVLWLAMQPRLDGFSAAERTALLASVLVHDAGTPPFAHLLEYHLRERFNWSHESVLVKYLERDDEPEALGRRVLGNELGKFRATAKRVGIDYSLVKAILSRKHPLAALLFSEFDLDNLDNVLRMSWALAASDYSPSVCHLAADLGVTKAGHLLLARRGGEELIGKWLRLRYFCYSAITRDPATVGAQALLSKAMGVALQCGALTVSNWPDRDEQLIETLLNHPQIAELTNSYLNYTPSCVLIVNVFGSLKDHGFESREQAEQALVKALAPSLPQKDALPYVFVDRRAFNRRVKFIDPEDGVEWQCGDDSASVVYGLFVAKRDPPSAGLGSEVFGRFLAQCKIRRESVTYAKFGDHIPHDGQKKLDF